MIVTSKMIYEKLDNYSNKKAKLTREVNNKKLIKIVKGLYETDKNTKNYLLASSIYGPSYISFDYALSYYQMIPERVDTVTCATLAKKKFKIYKTYFGNYTYQDVPAAVYSLGVKLIKEGEYVYQIATPEKALCDKLYILHPIKNLQKLEIILFKDLRIDETKLKELNLNDIKILSEKYNSNNVMMLYKYLKRCENE